MASLSNAPPALLEEFAQGLAAQQIKVAMLTLGVFDFLLCFPREVDLLWGQRLRLGSWMYLLARYPFLISLFMAVFLTTETPNCDVWVKVASTINLISAVPGAAFAMTRAWALYGRKAWVIVFYLALYIPWLGMSMKILVTTSCTPSSTSLESLTQLLLAFMNGISLILNLFIVILTVNRTWSSVRTLRSLDWQDTQSMMSLLLYDGSIYFVVLFIADLMNTITAYRAPAPLQSTASVIGAVLATNLVCRFILDLREIADPFNGQVTLLDSTVSSLAISNPKSHTCRDSVGTLSTEKQLVSASYLDHVPNGGLWIGDLGAFPDYGAHLRRSGGNGIGGGAGAEESYYRPQASYDSFGSLDIEKALPSIPALS